MHETFNKNNRKLPGRICKYVICTNADSEKPLVWWWGGGVLKVLLAEFLIRPHTLVLYVPQRMHNFMLRTAYLCLTYISSKSTYAEQKSCTKFWTLVLYVVV